MDTLRARISLNRLGRIGASSWRLACAAALGGGLGSLWGSPMAGLLAGPLCICASLAISHAFKDRASGSTRRFWAKAVGAALASAPLAAAAILGQPALALLTLGAFALHADELLAYSFKRSALGAAALGSLAFAGSTLSSSGATPALPNALAGSAAALGLSWLCLREFNLGAKASGWMSLAFAISAIFAGIGAPWIFSDIDLIGSAGLGLLCAAPLSMAAYALCGIGWGPKPTAGNAIEALESIAARARATPKEASELEASEISKASDRAAQNQTPKGRL